LHPALVAQGDADKGSAAAGNLIGAPISIEIKQTGNFNHEILEPDFPD